MNLISSFLPFLTTPKRYKFAFGGRGSGKSRQCAMSLLALGASSKKRILCAREIQKSIKDSVHVLLGDIITGENLPFEVLNNEIRGASGTEIIFTGLRDHTAATIKSYEGIGICWVEEAQAVSKKSLDFLLPTIRDEGSEIWFSFNRLLEVDPVYELFRQVCDKHQKKILKIKGVEYPFLWHEGDNAIGIEINYNGNPYFTAELFTEMERDKVENYDLYLHKWEGQPENQGGYALIARGDVKKAVGRQVRDDWDYVAFGVDPARFGDDESVMCIREGLKVLPVVAFNGIDTMRLVGEIIATARDYYAKGHRKEININVDETGIGAGVIDRLNELDEQERVKAADKREFNIFVTACVNNGEAIDGKYRDFGAESWGGIKTALETISLPDDETLISQLTSRKYKIESDGRIKLEKKDEFKKRGFKSPDRADALALCLWPGNPFNLDGLSIENVKR